MTLPVACLDAMHRGTVTLPVEGFMTTVEEHMLHKPEY